MIKSFYRKLQKKAVSAVKFWKSGRKANEQFLIFFSYGYIFHKWLFIRTVFRYAVKSQSILAQFETIKKIAEKESCVIVGRCADYALAENPNCINVFIHADKEFRTKRVAAELQVNESKAKDAIQKKDKQRASYYNYYTSKKWGDSRSYHLTLDSSALGIDKCVEMILQYRALYLMK